MVVVSGCFCCYSCCGCCCGGGVGVGEQLAASSVGMVFSIAS